MALAAFIFRIDTIIAITSLGILSYYAIVNLAALSMKRQTGGFEIPSVIPFLGFLSCSLIIVWFLSVSLLAYFAG
jgi:hypothetical protein